MESAGAATSYEPQGMKRKAAEAEIEDEDDAAEAVMYDEDEEVEEEDEGVKSAYVIDLSLDGGGSIYHHDPRFFHSVYHLHDTGETRLDAMALSPRTPDCHPSWTKCKKHEGCDMLQIYSLKLAKPPPPAAATAAAATGGPIQLYGFMAVRDFLDPLRNYVFNRSRDDPFVIQDVRSDPFIYLSGPKRGIYLQCRALIEFDLKMIKVGEGSGGDDLPLVEGAIVCSEMTSLRGPWPERINGRGGAVDISYAVLRRAVEATVEVSIVEVAKQRDGDHGGLDLFVYGCMPPEIAEKIRLFRGVIDEPCRLRRFVIAVNSCLVLGFEAVGTSHPVGQFAFGGAAHGSYMYHEEFEFATVELTVTWSSLI